MKARGGRFLLILGGGLAAMAFLVVYILTSKGAGTASQAASVPTVAPTVNLAVVNQDVPAYTVLDSTNVATTEVDATAAVSNTTTAPSALYGKMTLVPLSKGQPVLTNQVTQTGFSNILAKGERAFSYAVPERNTFGNAITENDRVDLVWTHRYDVTAKVPDADGKFKFVPGIYTSTKTLLQDVKVLRTINLRVPPAPPSGQDSQGQPAKAPPVTGAAMYEEGAGYQETLILAVTDQQAEVIEYARMHGTIDLTLRSSATTQGADGKDVRGDHDVEKTTGISMKELVEQYGVIAPPPVIDMTSTNK